MNLLNLNQDKVIYNNVFKIEIDALLMFKLSENKKIKLKMLWLI